MTSSVFTGTLANNHRDFHRGHNTFEKFLANQNDPLRHAQARKLIGAEPHLHTKFLANPDLPARIAAGADLNAPKADLFYTGKVGDLKYTGPEGYTDYPTLTPN